MTMEFKFRKKHYVLKRDTDCFVLSSLIKDVHKDAPLGTLKESQQRYFVDLNQAIKYLFNQHVLDKNKYTSIIEKIEQINKELNALFKETTV